MVKAAGTFGQKVRHSHMLSTKQKVGNIPHGANTVVKLALTDRVESRFCIMSHHTNYTTFHLRFM
jgi:hypothetical protein